MATALFCTSPVGGGHVLRDLAVARELKSLIPALEVIHVASGPAARMLRERGERVEDALRPVASHVRGGRLRTSVFYLDFLVSDLVHALQIGRLVRRHGPHLLYLDEVFAAAYLGRALGLPTVVAGDMAGGPKHSLRREPASALLNHFLTFLAGGAMLVADCNLLFADTSHVAEEHRRFAEQHMNIVGPVSQLSLTPPLPMAEARGRLGYGLYETVVTVSVGGSATGADLLRASAEAFALLRGEAPRLRMALVAGPDLDPAELGIRPRDGLELHGHVLDLVARFCASDAAVVQAGYTTLTECIGAGVPIVAVPLEGLWEQEANSRWAMAKVGAYVVPRGELSGERLAEAVASALAEGRSRPRRPAREGGARRAARIIAECLLAKAPDLPGPA